MSQLYIQVLFAMSHVAPTCNSVNLYIIFASASQVVEETTHLVAAIIHFVFEEIGHAVAVKCVLFKQA